ncbi:MAG: rRNA maturation RNase YbeY [Fimbriimonadaceae bacterium]
MEAALRHVFEQHGVPSGEASVLITVDGAMEGLNRKFRGTDGPTDVLSFPAPATVPGQVGDIAVSIDFARRQAEARGVPIEDEVAMLVIHGALHLAGFDDGTPEQRAEMVARMNEAAASCGIATDDEWSSLPHGGGC